MSNSENKNIEYIPIKKLKPYKKNAKKHCKKQIEQLANSIKEFGFQGVVLYDSRTMEVVAGHGRILGAKKAGLKQVPCIDVKELTEEQIKAYRLVDNKLNESEWDFSLLDAELEDIIPDNIDMELFGFDLEMEDEELEELMHKEVKFTAKEKHLVIITCKSEKETLKAKKEIEQLGYSCDVKNT